MDPVVVDKYKKIMEHVFETMIQAKEELNNFCPIHCAEMNDEDADKVHGLVKRGYYLLENYKTDIECAHYAVLSWYT
jgi:hypothetical protein